MNSNMQNLYIACKGNISNIDGMKDFINGIGRAI